MKFKIWQTAVLCLLVNVSFASIPTSFLANESYTCGQAPVTATDANWCSCYANFLQVQCHAMGGDDSNCNDSALRQTIQEYGGAEVVCQYFPNSAMDVSTCEQTLSYYLKQCPI